MNEKTKQVPDADDIIKKVGDVPTYLRFINTVCLTDFIKKF